MMYDKSYLKLHQFFLCDRTSLRGSLAQHSFWRPSYTVADFLLFVSGRVFGCFSISLFHLLGKWARIVCFSFRLRLWF